MTFKYKHKKTQTSKTQRKEEKRTRSDRERESTPFRATAELLSAVLPPLSRRYLGGSATLFNLGMSLSCQAPTIFLPQFVADPTPKPEASITDPFRRLCLCFGMSFGIYVCVSEWISSCVCVSVWVSTWNLGWVSGFVCISGLCFGRGFGPLSAFQAAFLLVVLNLLVSIWVAHISTLFLVFLIWVLFRFLLVF